MTREPAVAVTAGIRLTGRTKHSNPIKTLRVLDSGFDIGDLPAWVPDTRQVTTPT
jgi:hypothetical protein